MIALRSSIGSVGTATWLIWRSIRAMARQLLAGDPLAERGLADALGQFVWTPLPRLMALAGLVGVIAGVSAGKILALYNAELLVVGALVDAMLRQILPLVVGVFASGSVSVEIASRLGAMSLAQEIDALEAMGHDPVDHALAPPATAVIVATPVHMVAAALAALISAGLVLNLSANIPARTLLDLVFSGAASVALLTGVAKVLLFALIALGVGAAVGSRPVRSPGQIGRRAGQAFTAGLLGIFAAGATWAALG